MQRSFCGPESMGSFTPVRDRDVDEELLGLLKERPNVFFALTLFAPRLDTYVTDPHGSTSRRFARRVSPEADRADR